MDAGTSASTPSSKRNAAEALVLSALCAIATEQSVLLWGTTPRKPDAQPGTPGVGLVPPAVERQFTSLHCARRKTPLSKTLSASTVPPHTLEDQKSLKVHTRYHSTTVS